jgi:ferric-dicitrate binding protein FerR (iron transport regulator)
MITTEFRQLLEKWRKNECTPEEENLLRGVFDGAENDMKEQMISEMELMSLDFPKENVDFDRMLLQIKDRITTDPPFMKKTRFIKNISRIAAIAMVALLTGAILSYLFFSKKNENQVSYYQVKAPLGGRSELTLPDGSVVWLNAGSSIRYDNRFNEHNRNLYLEGEGYFKVAKNKKLPFIVKTSDINIKAVGTEFNVKAYAGDNSIVTTLIEGKITLEKANESHSRTGEVFLEPNQKAVYVKNSGKIDVNSLKKIIVPQALEPISVEKDLFVGRKIDPLPDVAWKENELIFKRIELEDMAITLERKYNIAIHFGSDEVKKFRFTGTLKDETLQQVLDVIKMTSPIDYSLDGKEVTIYENETAHKEFVKHFKKQ